MGPWSADLPDVSPPEKQPACQRGRLFKHTLRRASSAHACGLQCKSSPSYVERIRNVHCGCREHGSCSPRQIFAFKWDYFLRTLISNIKI